MSEFSQISNRPSKEDIFVFSEDFLKNIGSKDPSRSTALELFLSTDNNLIALQ